jgi:Asp-tRNA(Asn)/Glu-tRNA(Gln) amidotransferase A subunit family amidase
MPSVSPVQSQRSAAVASEFGASENAAAALERANQTANRGRILTHTTPVSVAGLPAVVLPSADCGIQLIGAHNQDAMLLRLAVELGERLARSNGI